MQTLKEKTKKETIKIMQPIVDNGFHPMWTTSLSPASIVGRPLHSTQHNEKSTRKNTSLYLQSWE